VLAGLAYIGTQIGLWRLAGMAYHPPQALRTMVTFGPALVSSENSHIGVMLHSVLLYLFSGYTEGSLLVASGNILGTTALLQYLEMFLNNIQSREHFKSELQKAGFDPDDDLGYMTLGRWLKTLVPVWQLARRAAGIRGGVVVHRDIKYHTFQSGRSLRIDVYLHQRAIQPGGGGSGGGGGGGGGSGATHKLPCFMYIHGGGFITGDKAFASIPLLYQVAAKGYVVVSVNYRLAPRVPYHSQLVDCKRALKFVKEELSHKFRIDPDFVVVGGESAGGQLALMMALTHKDKQYQPGFEDTDCTLQGCIDLYGVHDMLDSRDSWARYDFGGFKQFIKRVVVQNTKSEVIEKVSPLWIVQQPSTVFDPPPPIMGIHGTHDSLVPIMDAEIFYQHLADMRHQHATWKSLSSGSSTTTTTTNDAYVRLPNTHHAFNYLLSARSVACGDAVTTFMGKLARDCGAQPRM